MIPAQDLPVEISEAGPPRGRARLRCRLFLPRPRDEVFAFFEDPLNLGELTPPEMQFRIRAEGPITMRAGAVFNYRLKMLGLPLSWQSEITVYEPGVRFVDVQRKGPYREWVHEHRFTDAEGGTLCEDEVTYCAPFGGLARRIVVDRKLRWIFNYRAERLRQRFGGPA